MFKRFFPTICIWLFALLVYANHFDNAFQFDDYPTITSNPSVTRLSNIPYFFLDPSTATGIANRSGFRPILMTSFAVDYSLAGDFQPFVFHVSSFLFFLVLLALMYHFLEREFSRYECPSRALAFVSTAFFALHPVTADCVNYIVQRGEIFAALGIVGGLVLFQRGGVARSRFLYLVPPIFGCLSKEIGYVFPMLLFSYIYINAERKSFFDLGVFFSTLKTTVPSVIVLGVLAVGLVFSRLSAETMSLAVVGGATGSQYFATQLFIVPDYIRSFFLPIDLSGDSDWGVVASFRDSRIYLGAALVLLLLWIAYVTAQVRSTRLVSLGIAWFFIALLPTSTFSPLAEVRNSHRMFLPFIGLIPAIVAAGYGALSGLVARRSLILLPCVAMLVAFSYATHERNKVWSSAETFWRDVTLKSPRNGRGLMNYGLTLMSKGLYQEALAQFEEALPLTPTYSSLHTNLGIAHGALQHQDKAEQYYKQAIALAPRSEGGYFFYGRWLFETARYDEAVTQLSRALSLNPRYRDAAVVLLFVLEKKNDWASAQKIATQALQALGEDLQFQQYLQVSSFKELAAKRLEEPLSAGDYIKSTLELSQAKRFPECIRQGLRGVEAFPEEAIIWNNLAACELALNHFTEAERCAAKAVKLNPKLSIAVNNMNYARQKLKEAAR